MPSARTLELRLAAAAGFNNECHICRRAVGDGTGFLFHHLWYVRGEKTSKDFGSQTAYHEYLIPIVLKRPKGFMLLCNGCHGDVKWKDRYDSGRLRRMFGAIMAAKRRAPARKTGAKKKKLAAAEGRK